MPKQVKPYRGYRCSLCGKYIKYEEDMNDCPKNKGSHILSINAMFDDRFWKIKKEVTCQK